MPNGKIKVKMIGTISTTLGISMYCEALAKHLSKWVELTFIEFDDLYPSFLSPLIGGRTGEERTHSTEGYQLTRGLDFHKPWTWLNSITETNEHILHLQWWSPILVHIFVFLGLVSRLLGRKVVTTVHNVYHHEHRFLGTLANKAIFRISDFLVVHSESNKKTLISDFNFLESRVFVIPHGLLGQEVGVGEKSLTIDEMRNKLNIYPDSPIVLFLGHIRRYKGLDLLLRAFSNVLKTHPNSILLICGKPWNDWQEYSSLIHELGIKENVRLILDFVPDHELETIFSLADLVVLPYRSFDSQSGIGLIALQHGKAMVVTNTGGLSDLVTHPVSLVQPGNTVQLEESISAILDSRELKNKLEADAVQIRDSFGWHDISKKTYRLYRYVISMP